MSRLKLSTIAAGAAVTIALTAAASAQQITYNLWSPPASPEYRVGLLPYFERVKEKTDGKFDFQIFTAGQMLGPLETLGGVRDGAISGGFVFEQFYPNEIPNTYMINETNGFNDDIMAASGASQEMYFECEECLEEAQNAGVMMLGGHSTAPYILMCRNEINSVEDIEGKRIRGTTAFHNAIINTFGGVGVNMSFAEITQAVERGAVDCVLGTESWLTSFGIEELIRTSVPEPNFGSLPTAGFITFNRGVWDGFDPEVRQALIEEMPAYIADVTWAFINEREEAVERAKAAGMKEVDLGEAFAEKYDAWQEAERNRVIQAASARGYQEGEAFLDTYLAKYEEWKELTANIGVDDKEEFRQLVWDRIYSKLDH